MNRMDSFGNKFDALIERLESWFKAPSYSDPDLQRKAEILHTLSNLILVMALATITITPFVYSKAAYGLPLTVGVIIFCLVIQTLNRVGEAKLAAHIFVLGVWLFDTAVVFLSGGFYSHYLISYLTITVMGGLLLGGMYAFHFAGISIGTYLVFFLLENQGIMPEPFFSFTPIALIIINTVNILLAASTLVMMLVKYELNFRELIQKEASLSSINQKLNWEILARTEAETLLRGSEERLRSALMGAPYPTMLHTVDGEILLVNTAWMEDSGFSSEEMASLDAWLDKFYRESRAQVREIFTRLAAGEQDHIDGNLDLYTKRGETLSWYLRWTRLPQLPDGRSLILTMATDMTSLLSIESALRKSEENYSKFALVTSDGLWDWNLATDDVLFDPHYYTMAGYEVNEFPHRLEEFKDRVHPDDVDRVFREAGDHLNGKADAFKVEFRFRQKDGSWLWILGRGKITEQDEYGNPLRFVGTHTDISAQKAIEEQLNQHQRQLSRLVEDRTQSLNERIAEVERLNAALTNVLDDYQTANQKLTALSASLSSTYQELESVTYSMSTDLKDPVQSIQRNAVRLLKRSREDLPAKTLKTMQQIHDDAALVDRRINDLLEISLLNRQELKLADIDAGALAKQVLDSFQKVIKTDGISVTTEQLPNCRGDAALLEQVFSHLVSNAIKFSRSGNEPQIRVGSQPGSSPGRVVYFIKDNGVGFKIKDQDRTFQTFQQLHDLDDNPGAGIGLIKAKIIINKHGGEIWAESKKGSGATIFFELERPLAEQANGPKDQERNA